MECIICTDPEHVRMAQALRYSVYCVEKAWVDAAQCENELEEDEYDDLAIHFLAMEDGAPIGTSRLLLGTRQTLPAAEYFDLEVLGLDPERVAEVSRLATHATKRSSDLRVFMELTRAMWHWGMENSVSAWLAVADVPLYRLLQRLGMPTIAVAPSIEYLGSACVPVVFDVEATGAVLYRTRTSI
jgi:N-acyl-L-homoserine lactone synthetase